jgi:Tfp pilus assembly PilM family ATPase
MLSKNKSSNSVIKNIVTLNVYSDQKYIFQGDMFNPLNKLTYNKSNFITSYVSNKDVISTTITVSRNIPNEDLADIIDIKAYEELGLDQATNYVISSLEVENNTDERKFHIFVAKPDVLDELYLPIKKETKYVDLIIPAPLLYKAIYNKEILQSSGVHCFIYFTQQDAFVTFYKDGEYLYAKSIDYSIEQIYDKYCEIIGEKVDQTEFNHILETEGLKTSKSDYQQNLMKIFSDVFININDIIIYVKRAFELDTVDHIFIGGEKGPIVGLDEYSQNYLGLQAGDLNFNYNINNDEWYADQLQFLMLLSSFDYLEDEDSVINLSIYHRPPSFVNRASGQFIIATFASVSIGIAYPLYYLVGSYVNDAKIYALDIENKKLSAEASKYKKIISEKLKEIEILDANINKLSTIYSSKTKTLSSIYNKKVNYKLKSELLHIFANELHQYDVNVNKIYSNNDIFWLDLTSENDRDITEFIKYISQKHFDSIKHIDIKKIAKDANNSDYNGLLKVELR